MGVWAELQHSIADIYCTYVPFIAMYLAEKSRYSLHLSSLINQCSKDLVTWHYNLQRTHYTIYSGRSVQILMSLLKLCELCIVRLDDIK